MRVTGKYDGIGISAYNRSPAICALLKDIDSICPIDTYCYGCVQLRLTTMAETKAAADKVGHPIQFGPECKDYVY